MREALSDKLLNGLQLSAHPQLQPVPVSIATLELLWCPEAAEGPVDHDSHSGAESLAFSHTVSGEQDGLARTGHTPDD